MEYFEPYGIVLRSRSPCYDPRFKGYGLNKVQHAWHIAAMGTRFLVVPGHFLVTVPHRRSPSFMSAFGTAADPAHRLAVEQLYGRFKQGLCGRLETER